MSDFDDYCATAVAYWLDHPEQRIGQAFFNTLAEHHHDVAEQTWGEHWPGGRDPFYREENLRAFLDYVRVSLGHRA